MKRKGIIALLISLTMVMAMFLAACGSKTPDTLEDYVNNDEDAKASIEQTATNSGLDVTISGNEVVYTYDLKNYEGMTEEVAKSDIMVDSLTQALDQSGSTFKDLCAQLEEESKISGISIVVTYTYDGEVLVTQTFNSGASEETEESEG